MTRTPAFSNVEYVTPTANSRWFIPTTGKGDNPDSGTTANQLAACKNLLGKDSDANQIGKAVQAGGADW